MKMDDKIDMWNGKSSVEDDDSYPLIPQDEE